MASCLSLVSSWSPSPSHSSGFICDCDVVLRWQHPMQEENCAPGALQAFLASADTRIHTHTYTPARMKIIKKKSLKSNLHPGTLHVCDSCAALSSCETPSSGNRVCLSLFYCLWDPIPHPGLGKCLVLLFPWETWMRSGLVGNRVWGEETGREGGRETCGWDVYVNTWISKCILKNF